MEQRWEVYPFGGALVLSLISFLTPGPDLPAGPAVSDKVEHAVIFAVLALTGRFAGFGAQRLFGWLIGYAVLSEVLQAALPIHRDGDWHDVVADTIGIVLGLGLAALVARAFTWGER